MTYTDIILDDDGTDQRNLWCIGHNSQDGDSGGPVYDVRSSGSVKPAGILWGRRNDNHDMCFHAVGYVLRDMDVDIYYAN